MNRITSVDTFAQMFSLEFIDIRVGVKYEFIDAPEVEVVATHYHDMLAETAGSSDFLVDMSLRDTSDEKLAVIDALADYDRIKLSTRKWLYSELVALFERQDEIDEVLV